MCSDKKYMIAHFVSVIKHSVGLLGSMLWYVEFFVCFFLHVLLYYYYISYEGLISYRKHRM